MPKVVVLLSSVVAGGCWLAALLLPWTAEGALSASSLLDAVELARSGRVDAVVPSYAALVLLVPSIAGIVLVGVVGLAGRALAAVRLAALVLGSVGVLALVVRLSGADGANLGPGAVVALGGVLAALVAVALTGRSGLLRLPTGPPATD
ncbi:hypothetical protein [Nocardioides stalactiti]|uniref:hypothetical protein n=1 Tax=Nocardioides stalactiti TaxID=2755356 RepID=UPI00160157EB|nr:hypothetical protein [Nocardioides stalactiti]